MRVSSKNKEITEMANIPFKFELGTRAKDRVTNLTGIIDARMQCLNGCLRYAIQPPMEKKDVEPRKSYWVDENSIDVIDEKLVDKFMRASGLAPG